MSIINKKKFFKFASILSVISFMCISLYISFTEKKNNKKYIFEFQLPTFDSYTLIDPRALEKSVRSDFKKLNLEYFRLRKTYPNSIDIINNAQWTLEVIDENVSTKTIMAELEKIIERENNRFLNDLEFKNNFINLINDNLSKTDNFDFLLPFEEKIYRNFIFYLTQNSKKNSLLKNESLNNSFINEIFLSSNNFEDFSSKFLKKLNNDERFLEFVEILKDEFNRYSINYYSGNIAIGFISSSYTENINSRLYFYISTLICIFSLMLVFLYNFISLRKFR